MTYCLKEEQRVKVCISTVLESELWFEVGETFELRGWTGCGEGVLLSADTLAEFVAKLREFEAPKGKRRAWRASKVCENLEGVAEALQSARDAWELFVSGEAWAESVGFKRAASVAGRGVSSVLVYDARSPSVGAMQIMLGRRFLGGKPGFDCWCLGMTSLPTAVLPSAREAVEQLCRHVRDRYREQARVLDEKADLAGDLLDAALFGVAL